MDRDRNDGRGREPLILAARRTPQGSFLGALRSCTAPALGACALRAVLADLAAGDAATSDSPSPCPLPPGERGKNSTGGGSGGGRAGSAASGGAGLDFAALDEVIMGCVLPAGLGQAPARQAALAAGIPVSVPCTTVNKMCGSGMKAVMLAADALRAGTAGLALAGGMESMSNAPHLLPGLRRGLRLGEAPLLDHMLHDGLRDPWEGESMGWYAEACADLYGFTRAEQDAYAALSVRRARAAQASGAFAAECVPVPIQAQGKGEAQTEVMMVTEDEEPGRCVHERIPHLKPAFRRAGGTVTAASSAGIADGAAALLLGTRAAAARWGLRPLARIRGQASHAGPPAEFPIAPIGAIRALLAQVGWSVGEVDLFEINEAFAVVVLAALRDLGGDLGLDPARVNVHGGACALGHPIGATGARILVTLLHALRRTGGRRGVATLCIGGGEATAMAIELLD